MESVARATARVKLLKFFAGRKPCFLMAGRLDEIGHLNGVSPTSL